MQKEIQIHLRIISLLTPMFIKKLTIKKYQRNLNFIIFPAALTGSESKNSISLGTL